MALNVQDILAQTWTKIVDKVRKSVVFIDNESAETLHWSAGGANRILAAGATDIKQLSSFECGRTDQKKAVFITSSLLFDVTADTIKHILEASSFQYVIVITNVSPAVHLWKKTGVLEDDERDVFYQFEEKLLEWMGDMNYTAEVHHMWHGVAALTPGLLVVPSSSDFFPFLPHEYKKLEMKQNVIKAMKTKAEKKPVESLADIDFAMLPEQVAEKVRKLVCSVNGLLEAMNVTDECYSIGHTSRIVATELASYAPARARRKAATERASVVFLDRTLDLAGVAGNHGDTLVDRIVNLLPRLPLHNNDVTVEMAELCNLHTSARPGSVVPGCLSHSTDKAASNLFAQMVSHKQKESTMELNRQLVQTATGENLPIKLTGKPGRITGDQLSQYIQLFNGHPASIRKHAGMLQLAQAAVMALKHPKSRGLDSLHGVEKLLLLAEADDTSIGAQLLQVLDRTGLDREFTIDQFLVLLVYVYSVRGDDIYNTAEEERTLQQKFSKCILMEPENELSSAIKSIVGDSITKDSIKEPVSLIFGNLQAVGQARQHMKRYKNVHESGGVGLPVVYMPLVKQVVDDIVDPAKPDLVDIDYRSAGLRDYLKTGFSLFMKVNKSRPGDCPVVIIFIIGGVTCNEARLIRDATAKSDCQVILAGTKLLNHSDLLNLLFVNDRQH